MHATSAKECDTILVHKKNTHTHIIVKQTEKIFKYILIKKVVFW